MHEVFSTATTASIGKHASNTLTTTDMAIEIAKNNGVKLGGGAAPLFDANMANASLAGRASSIENDASLLNFGALAKWYGDIQANQAGSGLTLPAASKGRFITPNGITDFATP